MRVSEEDGTLLTRERFTALYRNQRPVKLRNALQSWAALGWSGESLSRSWAEGAASQTVKVFAAHDNRTFVESDASTLKEEVLFSHVVQHCLGNTGNNIRNGSSNSSGDGDSSGSSGSGIGGTPDDKAIEANDESSTTNLSSSEATGNTSGVEAQKRWYLRAPLIPILRKVS
jgi:hypothetical protein